MLQAEKIQSNWDRYINEIKTNISKERTDILIPFLEKYQERLMMMPAAARNWHHSAFAGGYVDHVLRVYDCANKLYKIWKDMKGDTSTYTVEENPSFVLSRSTRLSSIFRLNWFWFCFTILTLLFLSIFISIDKHFNFALFSS